MNNSKDNKKKYPISTYLVGMFIVVVSLILLSYFAQQRNNDRQISNFSQEHSYKIEDVTERLDQLETRLDALENGKK